LLLNENICFEEIFDKTPKPYCVSGKFDSALFSGRLGLVARARKRVANS
jgi:hypothetical protein